MSKIPISPIKANHLTLSTSAYPFQEPNTSRYKSKTRFEPILDALPATLDGKSSILDRVIHCRWRHSAHCHAFCAGKKGTWGQESTFGKWFIRAMKRMLFSWSSSHIISIVSFSNFEAFLQVPWIDMMSCIEDTVTDVPSNLFIICQCKWIFSSSSHITYALLLSPFSCCGAQRDR